MRLPVLSDVYANAPPAARGVALMLATTLIFTGMQVTVRHVAEDMHPFEVAFLRNVFGLVVLSPLFLRSGFSVLRTSKLKLHAMRGVLQTAGMLIFFTALTLAPLTEVVALSFTSPLFATVLAILILREKRGSALGGVAGGLCGRPHHSASGYRRCRSGATAGGFFVAHLGRRHDLHQGTGPDRFEPDDHRLHGAFYGPPVPSSRRCSSGSGPVSTCCRSCF